ncbi:MAG TPA: PLDc N-terminal domain-containing protein, partial [Limosilactobacillus ingluviei]|nr:PLDc N-terminal domain-containing protein [Limosilactobacillus ingluviei]
MLITWHIIKSVLFLIVVFNEVAALITVFRERRDIAATWAWLLVLTLLPVVGFIFYSFLGRKLPQRRLERIQTETQLELSAALDKQKAQFLLSPQPKQPTLRTYKRTIMLFQSIDDAFLTRHNHVDLFSEGHHFFGQLLKDIAAAKH